MCSPPTGADTAAAKLSPQCSPRDLTQKTLENVPQAWSVLPSDGTAIHGPLLPGVLTAHEEAVSPHPARQLPAGGDQVEPSCITTLTRPPAVAPCSQASKPLCA